LKRELCFELARVTEAAALNAIPWRGKGNKNSADRAAVKAMRDIFRTVNIEGEIVTGEGEKDKAPKLKTGEKVGNGQGLEMDIAVDPIEGTSLVARGLPGAMTVIAVAAKGNMPGIPDIPMKKIAVGPAGQGVININNKAEENICSLADIKGKKVEDITVAVLNRPRHQKLISEIRKLGAGIKLINEGDIAAGIATAIPDSDIDLLMGIGGGPEGVLTAAALKCLGGDMQAQLYPDGEEEIEKIICSGIGDIHRNFKIDDLVGGQDIIFSATGVTDGELLNGVIFRGERASTHSLILDNLTGEILEIHTLHNIEELYKHSDLIIKPKKTPG